MLEKIRVRNYKSIIDTTLTLDTKRRRAASFDTISSIEENGKKAVPFVVIYGANSSGKSTLLEALSSALSIARGDDVGKHYLPNIFHSGNDPCEVSFTLIKGNTTWDYTLIYDKEMIKEERLISNGDLILNAKEEKFSLLKEKSEFYSLLSTSFVFYDPFSYSAEESLLTYIRLSGKSERECIDDAVELMKRLDFSLTGIKRGEEWSIEYRSDGSLSLMVESEGTRRLLSLLFLILASLSIGGILVADEIDVSLHPLVLRALFALFIDREYNKKGAQLISSSHNTDLMDAPFVREDEIALFEKTKKRGSDIERLSEKTGGKRVRNIRKGYLEGRYSALPFPYI